MLHMGEDGGEGVMLRMGEDGGEGVRLHAHGRGRW